MTPEPTTLTTPPTADTAPAPAARRRSESLPQAARRFARYWSPRLIAALWVGAVVARLAVGEWLATDLVVVVVMLAAQPLVEWVIHVTILHWRPRRVGGLTIDHLLARKHREHHADPTNTELVFIPTPIVATLVPTMVAVAVFAFPRLSLGLTWLATQATIGLIYEWTHFLVHSDVKPKGRLYRAIWRHHRLHHYKNEHYWFSISATWPDHLLRTAPSPADVPSSPTVKALHADSDVG